jgi:hypothetical protein
LKIEAYLERYRQRDKHFKQQKNMKLKIIKPAYVTATVKRHLHAFLESGKTSAKVNTKHYSILKGTPLKNGYEYVIVINTPYTRESTGQREFEKQTIICQYLNDSEALQVNINQLSL